MPFIRDYSNYEPPDDSEEDDSDELLAQAEIPFVYEEAPGTTKFNFAKLDDISQTTLKALIEIKGTIFRIRYDGGMDEGFAYPEHVVVDGKPVPMDRIVDQLIISVPALLIKLRARYKGEKPADEIILGDRLDELADQLASVLLMDGYGTGEYSMYGAFTANLITGEMVDDPKAAKPDKEW